MHNFVPLFKGEMQRLVKYKILQIAFVVTLLWLAVLFLIGEDSVAQFVPLFIFMDATMMTVMLVGANLFYEKQENTLKTLLITPSGFAALMTSKFLSAIVLAFQSTAVISLFAYFLFDVTVSFGWLFMGVALITFMHTALGFLFTVFVKDFTGLLALLILYMFVFAFPSIFYALGVFGESAEVWLMFSPTHASLLLIEFAYGLDVRTVLLPIGAVYLLVVGVALIKWVVVPKYVETAVKE